MCRDSLISLLSVGKRGSGLILFLGLVGLMTLVLMNPAMGQNDATAQAQLELARSYRDNQQYSEAEQTYANIISSYPQTDYALQAYQDLALMQMDQGLVEAVETTRLGLMQDFANHPDISTVVTHIGDAWRQKGYHTEALAIYNDVTSRWPNGEYAMWSAMGRAICYAHLEDDAAAQAEVDAMITTFAEQQGLVQAVSSVGDEYRKLEKWVKSRIHYRYVVENHPEAQFALWSGMGLAIASVRLNDLETAAQSTERLLADFPEDARLSNAACQIADEYRRTQQYEAACPLYQYVVDNWPEAEFALWSRMGLAIANVRMKNLDAAAESTERLLADFPEDIRMPNAACQIGDEYRQAQQFEAANPVYQYVVNNWPETEQAFWSRMGLTIALIGQDQEAEAVKQIDQLLSKYTNDKRMSLAMCLIGDAYHQYGNWESAQILYQYIHEHWPGSKHEIWGYAGVIRGNIRQKHDDQVTAAVNSLTQKFQEHAALANALFVIGEEYYNIGIEKKQQGILEDASGNFSKALRIWQIIVDELPQSNFAPEAHYFVAVCYKELGDYKTAIEYYQATATEYPQYQYAWNASFQIGRCYEKMKKTGSISASEAEAKTKTAYELVAQKYPDCPLAKAAQNWLRRNRK